MRVTAFAGPSISAEECRALLPDAVVRPPAEQGDLLHAHIEDRAELLILIDGTFHQNLSVWHNEVCYLLSLGVHIVGASSMGALRAVETERFGTIGVGTIFEWYRDGVLTDDDEVALLHGPPEASFQSLSLPMVNIRASLQAVVAEDRVASETAAVAVAVAKSLFYPDRCVPQILDGCRESGVEPAGLKAIEDALTNRYIDLKAIDARSALLHVAEVVAGRKLLPPPKPFEFTRSSVFETLYNVDRAVAVDGGAIRLEAIATYSALNCDRHQEMRKSALNRELAVFLGMLLGVKVTPDEIAAEAASFRASQGLLSDEVFHAWLHENAWTEADLGEYLAQEAICRRLRQWIAFARGFDRGIKATLDELRVQGVFSEMVSGANELELIVENFAGRREYAEVGDIDPGVLAAQHSEATGVSVSGDVRRWASEAGLEGVDALIEALREAAVARDVRQRISQQIGALQNVSAEQAVPDGSPAL